MPATFRMVSVADSSDVDGVASDTVTLLRDADLRAGDFLLAFIVVTDVAAEASTLTVGDGWVSAQVSAPAVGDVRVYRAFKYVDDPAAEPAIYTFTYAAARGIFVTLLAYRGVSRDVDFDTDLYPYGYFAPAGSVGGTLTGSGSTISTPTSPHTDQAYTRIVSLLVARVNTATEMAAPSLDDPNPLIPILLRGANQATYGSLDAYTYGDCVSVMVLDEELASATDSVSARTVGVSQSVDWIVVTVPLESAVPVAAAFDTYKAKMLRSFFTPPYDARASTPLGKLLLVIGRLDNDIGGLHGVADFLPDDPDSTL